MTGRRLTRRTMLAGGVAALAAGPMARAAGTGAAESWTLLGTGGGPIARRTRSQPANLMQVDGRHYLIDAGDGVARQLVTAGVRLSAVDAVFLSHLHFDHTAGLPAFMALTWQDRRRTPLPIYGPPGTADFVRAGLAAFASSEAIFRPQLPDLGPMQDIFVGHDLDVTAAAEVFRDDRLRVTAVENSHYSTVHLPLRSYGHDRSLSYRFDTARRRIAYTGDTGPSAAVEALARDVDILVSEVIDLPAILASLQRRAGGTAIDLSPLIAHMRDEHLTPEHVGELAQRARARRLVLTHFAQPPGEEEVNARRIMAGVRRNYRGPVTLGRDLLRF